MNFLDQIWLIPLFPLFGAALMLLFGKQARSAAESEVAVAPGVEPIYEHGHDHGHARTHDHGHDHDHDTTTRTITITAHDHDTITARASSSLAAEIPHQFDLPGDGAALLHLLGGRGVAAFAADRAGASGDPVHLARRAAVPHGQRPDGHLLTPTGAFCSIRSAP